MSLLYNLGSIFVNWEIINVSFMASLEIDLQTIKVFGFTIFCWSIVVTLFILIAFVIGLRLLEVELDKLLSSSELESLDEELDKDNEDEDSF